MKIILLKGSMLSLVLALILVSGFAFAQADFKDGEPFGESLGAALAWPPLGPFLEIRMSPGPPSLSISKSRQILVGSYLQLFPQPQL